MVQDFHRAGKFFLDSEIYSKLETTILIDGKNGSIALGVEGNAGDIFVKNKKGENTIHLDGEEGDIKLFGADCAEDFMVCEAVAPGSVMVIGQEGSLVPCAEPYDKKVAGVISGAGKYKPGIRLGQGHYEDSVVTEPLALVGRVYCLVDADIAPIEVGDMLTTSTTRGHAMKVQNKDNAFGCILGKALSPLAQGKSLIPILVTLQ